MTFLQNAGLSHSEIRGSKVICTYPQLIAAYHVLHRLREPRHPPCALIYFLLSPGSSPFLKKDLNQMVRYILLALTKFTFFVHHVKERLASKLIIKFVTRVENNGFEPLTLCVQGRCSSQLS